MRAVVELGLEILSPDSSRVGLVQQLVELRLQVDLGRGSSLYGLNGRLGQRDTRLLNGIKSTSLWA